MNRQQRRKADRDTMKRAEQHARQHAAEHDRGPIETAYRAKMEAIAQAIDDVLNDDAKGTARTTGFCLLVFPFADAEAPDRNRLNYISNADTLDMLTLFKEQIARLEARTGQAGTA